MINQPPKPFTTDQCSGGMSCIYRFFTGKELPWAKACEAHDKKYWKGGTAYERLKADFELVEDMYKLGYVKWGGYMHHWVRIGGHPLLPTPWRWGYGWNYPQCAPDGVKYQDLPEKLN